MFSIDKIEALYNADFIGKNNDSYIWNEKPNGNPDALLQVEFVFKGGVIRFVKPGLLDKMKDAFRTNDAGALRLRKICDGFLFLERNEEHYFIILEVKSGFKEVKQKAINQIPASYVKAKSILNDFVSYNKADYQEFGLVVSYPYVSRPLTDSENNPRVMENKRKMIGDKNEIITSKYSDLLKNHQSAVFYGSDFDFDKLTSVKPDLFFETLQVEHCPVPNKCVTAIVDLDKIINAL